MVSHLYTVAGFPSAQTGPGHCLVTPPPDVYGKQSSDTVPYFLRKSQATLSHPPLQPMLLWSQATKYSGERTTLTLLLDAMQNLSERASVAPNAQHEPQCAWSLIGVMQSAQSPSLESKGSTGWKGSLY